MNSEQAHAFVSRYFRRLFDDHDLNALDDYLHPNYWDDDIGDSAADHIENAKSYLAKVFGEKPRLRVDVRATIALDDVIMSYLEWYEGEGAERRTQMKGAAIFVLDEGRILKRHTYIYEKRAQ